MSSSLTIYIQVLVFQNVVCQYPSLNNNYMNQMQQSNFMQQPSFMPQSSYMQQPSYMQQSSYMQQPNYMLRSSNVQSSQKETENSRKKLKRTVKRKKKRRKKTKKQQSSSESHSTESDSESKSTELKDLRTNDRTENVQRSEQGNSQGILFVPYPYPLVVTGLQLANKNNINCTTHNTKQEEKKSPKVMKLIDEAVDSEEELFRRINAKARMESKKNETIVRESSTNIQNTTKLTTTESSKTQDKTTKKITIKKSPGRYKIRRIKKIKRSKPKPSSKTKVKPKKRIKIVKLNNKNQKSTRSNKNKNSNKKTSDKRSNKISVRSSSKNYADPSSKRSTDLKNKVFFGLQDKDAEGVVEFKDIIALLPGHKQNTKPLTTSTRLTKKSSSPKYGIVPISDNLAKMLLQNLKHLNNRAKKNETFE